MVYMAGIESKIDPDLLGRVAALTPAQQRWLRTALQAIDTIEPQPGRTLPRAQGASARRARPSQSPSPALDELLDGAKLDEQIEAYPELAQELEGISDVIDLLREAGRRRRRKGEEVLRDIQGRQAPEEEEPSEDGEDSEAEEEPPEREA